MPTVYLYELPGAKRAGELARLVERLYRERRNVVIWVADEGRLQILDDYLWTYERLAFLPHAVWTEAGGDTEDPVVLVSREANPNRAGVLVVGDDPPSGAWIATFEEIYDLIPAGDAGEARRGFWEQWCREFEAEMGAT